MITSKLAALVVECGSRKTVQASRGSKSKHEHASRRTALFSGEGTRALGLLHVDQRLRRRGQANAGYVFCCYLRERLPFGCR